MRGSRLRLYMCPTNWRSAEINETQRLEQESDKLWPNSLCEFNIIWLAPGVHKRAVFCGCCLRPAGSSWCAGRWLFKGRWQSLQTSFNMEATKELSIANATENPKNGSSSTVMVQIEGQPGGIPPCPDSDSYPTIAEFNETLGGWASVLYIVSAVIVVILALQYGFLVGKFNKNVPNQRKVLLKLS